MWGQLPFVGGAGRILLETLGLFKSEREQARLKPLESVTVGSVLWGRSATANQKVKEKDNKMNKG